MLLLKKINLLLFYMLEQVSKMAISHVPGSTYQILRESFLFCYLTNFKTRLQLRPLHLIEKSYMLLIIKKYQKLVFLTA